MDITIKTLTPLWTGGIDGKVDRIHETTLLGSLRWWMEALVRRMGGNVCDPTEQKCSVKNGLCEVCKIFGAEGQKRRFRLEVLEIDISNATIEHPIKANRTYTENGQQKTPTWYFPDPTQNSRPQANTPKQGIFILQVQSLHPSFRPDIIGGLIQFIADWSALGARPQMGFGVIRIEGSRIDTQPLYDWLITTVGNNTSSDLPSLQNIFLAKIQPKNSSPAFTEQDTFNLKYDLRNCFRTEKETELNKNTAQAQSKSGHKGLILKKDKQESNVNQDNDEKDLRHFIMGTVENERMAAKVKISRPYEENGTTVMRVWGWIPEVADVYQNGWDREKVVDMIYQHLSRHYTLQVWREMNSQRDTVTPNESNAQPFLHSLLNLQESSHANS
jgi:CRISPR-associated protein Cmr1